MGTCAACKKSRGQRAVWQQGRHVLRNGNVRSWSADELAILRDMAGRYFSREISAALIAAGYGRTQSAVTTQAHKMGISLRILGQQGRYTMHSLGPALGVSHHTIRAWMAHGYLKPDADSLQAGCRHGATCNGGFYRFSLETVENFLRVYPYFVEWQGVKHGLLRSIAELAQKKAQAIPMKDAAHRAHVPYTTLSKWVLTGSLPSYKSGCRTRVIPVSAIAGLRKSA